jgi:hypothetical protein
MRALNHGRFSAGRPLRREGGDRRQMGRQATSCQTWSSGIDHAGMPVFRWAARWQAQEALTNIVIAKRPPGRRARGEAIHVVGGGGWIASSLRFSQ